MKTGVFIFGIIFLFLLAGVVDLSKLSLTGHATIESCTPKWECTEFSECVDKVSIRSCVDTNLCGNETNKPEETKECVEECIPDWQCTEWKPETCPENQLQTRTCTDKNNCNTNRERPEEGKTCEYQQSYEWLFVVAIILGVLTILLILVLILSYWIKTTSQKKSSYQPYPRTIPPSKQKKQSLNKIEIPAPIQPKIEIPTIPEEPQNPPQQKF